MTKIDRALISLLDNVNKNLQELGAWRFAKLINQMNIRTKKIKSIDKNQMEISTTHVTITRRIYTLYKIAQCFRKFVRSRPRYHRLRAAAVLLLRAQKECPTGHHVTVAGTLVKVYVRVRDSTSQQRLPD